MTFTAPATPLRYHPGLETAEPDEAEVARQIVDAMGRIARTVFEHSGHAERGVHAKSHGLLRGELRVLDGLPRVLAQGLFARPATYPVILRLSTNPGDLLDDDVSTPRGLALKIIGVPGERLPDAPGGNQDFVMANAPAFAAGTPKAFLKSLKLLAATTDQPQALKKAFSAVMRGAEAALETVGGRSATLLSLGGQPRTHILGETFFTQVPIRYGDYVAKLQLRPASPELRALAGAALGHAGDPDALRDAVAEALSGTGAAWDLCAQLATTAEAMPIEDAAAVWPESESPYVPVARVTVAPQASWTEESHARIDDRMAFSPWHGLAAHRPLGAVMRVRKAVYEASARFRAEANHVTITEPDRDGARA